MSNSRIWTEYYDAFDYFDAQGVRPRCEPYVMEHGGKRPHSVVLVHGLTDSPFFMKEIGRYFHEVLGWNVYLPLLHGHGLKKPRGMHGVDLEEWKKNVDFALKAAAATGERVSIGGLSTGGALSAYFAAQSPSLITGGVFLFSAALDLGGAFGDLTEQVLRTPLTDVLDFIDDNFGKDLIGDNPYRYARMDKDGARELSELILEIDKLTGGPGQKGALPQPLFAAHSECDTAADIAAIEELVAKGKPGKAWLFRLGRSFEVGHASVVLKEDVVALNGSPLEKANPFFGAMMEAVKRFVGMNL